MQITKSYSIAEVCTATSLGRTSIFAAIRKGELIARKVGRRTIVLDIELSAWLNNRTEVNKHTKIDEYPSNGRNKT